MPTWRSRRNFQNNFKITLRGWTSSALMPNIEAKPHPWWDYISRMSLTWTLFTPIGFTARLHLAHVTNSQELSCRMAILAVPEWWARFPSVQQRSQTCSSHQSHPSWILEFFWSKHCEFQNKRDLESILSWKTIKHSVNIQSLYLGLKFEA